MYLQPMEWQATYSYKHVLLVVLHAMNAIFPILRFWCCHCYVSKQQPMMIVQSFIVCKQIKVFLSPWCSRHCTSLSFTDLARYQITSHMYVLHNYARIVFLIIAHTHNYITFSHRYMTREVTDHWWFNNSNSLFIQNYFQPNSLSYTAQRS